MLVVSVAVGPAAQIAVEELAFSIHKAASRVRLPIVQVRPVLR